MPSSVRHSRRPFARALAALVGGAAVVATAALPLAAQPRTFSSFTVFGDSFSDVGNARVLAFGLVPARFSNGPVWADYFGAAIGRAADVTPVFSAQPRPDAGVYAVGGALTGTGPNIVLTPTGTQTQVNRWCGITTPGTTCTRTANASGLYALFAGGNDVRGAAGQATAAAREAATVQAANNLLGQMDLLHAHGARNLFTMYLPDLGATPDRVGSAQSATLTQLTGLFNQTLADGIAARRGTLAGVTIWDLRLDTLFDNLLRQPALYGFTNTTQACTATPANLPACTGYVFFDGLHPTTASHQLVSRAAYDLVMFDRNVAVVPEPATVALLAGGLAVLGGVAARRRRAA